MESAYSSPVDELLVSEGRALKHVQVREYVRALVSGAAPGSPAPSERELVHRFVAEAEAALAEAVRLEPENAAILYHLGDTLGRCGKAHEAREKLRKAVEIARAKNQQDVVSKAQQALDKLR